MLSREYPSLYIDGGWQDPDSKERFDVISPATGEKIGFVPAANNADIDRAVKVLSQGGKVAILAGRGALEARDELLQTAELLGAPIVKALGLKID